MVAPLQKKWFRIEQSADGAILSCTEVDAKGCKGAHVRFYEGVDAADASAQAKAWHENRKVRNKWYNASRALNPLLAKHDRDRVKEARDRAKKAGLCQICFRVPATGFCCAKCRDFTNENKRRRDAGLTPLKRMRANQGRSPVELRASYTESARRSMEKRITVWGSRQALEHFHQLKHFDRQTPAQYRAWRVAQIVKLGGAAAAKALAEYESSRAESLDKQAGAAYKRASKARRAA